MLAPRESPELGSWEIFGLSLLGAGIVGASVVSWHWARRGPPNAALMHPGGEVTPAVVTPGHPAPGIKSSGYQPSWGPAPAADDWTQIPTTGPGYEVRRPKRAWGTKASVASVVAAMERFASRRDELGIVDPKTLDPLVARLGDMSKKSGGPLPPHKSHQRGRDLDLSFRGKLPFPALPVLLWSFLQDDNVSAIYLGWDLQRQVWEALELNPDLAPGMKSEIQYPLARHTGRTRVRYWDGHTNHIHVRFRK